MFLVADKFCANCVMHSWKQPEDKSSLRQCRGCRMILYCGKAYRKEHWEKVHKNHCHFLADPSTCPQSQHDAEICAFCRPPAGTGKGNRRMAGRDKKRNPVSSSYECVTKDMHCTPGLASPHPYPVAGARDDLLERSTIVVQNLVHKLKQNPRVAMTCLAELEELERFLWNKRMAIWRQRKVFSHPQTVLMACLSQDLVESVRAKMIQGKAGKDASELWKIIDVVLVIMGVITEYRVQDALKNPVDTMPEQFTDLVKMALDNKFEFLDVAEEIIDCLSTQIIPYEDIVKKLCGGKKRQNCSFCGVKIEVTEHYEIMINYDKKCSCVLFDSISIRKYSCGSQDCFTKASSRNTDMLKLNLAVATAFYERVGLRCDFCFKRCPIDKAHRCCNCLTVMYCSKSCHKKDKENHSTYYCIEDERKTKEDSSMRRQMGEMALETLAAVSDDDTDENRVAMGILNETLEAFQFEDSKKRGGDNPNTKREHDTSNAAAATVPSAEDDGSKSGTEHKYDRSASEARGAPDTENAYGRSKSGNGAAGGPNICELD